MTTQVVTSFSAAGWTQYGRRFVETFCRYWPREVALHAYSEDLNHRHLGDMLGRDLDRVCVCHDLRAPFFERHAGNARAQGRERRPGQLWPQKAVNEGQNWRYDAFRFAHKVFAILAAARDQSAGRLFWVDADTVTFAPVPIDLLDRVLPKDVAICCFDRGTYPSECGFVGYNLDHPEARRFIEDFADLYASDDVFDLPEWHDSYVFDWLRRRDEIPAHAIPYAPGQRRHPFVNSELGRYMDHLKGPRKAMGKTPVSDLATHRDVPYWNA